MRHLPTKREKLTLWTLLGFTLLIPIISLSLNNWLADLRSHASLASADLLLFPKTGTYQGGDTFPVEVKLDTHETKISGADITLKFDKNVLIPVSLDVPTPETSPFTDKIFVATDSGMVRMVVVVKKITNQLPNGIVSVGRINFRGLADGGTSALTFDRVQLVGYNGDNTSDVVIGMGQKDSASLVINELNSTSPRIQFKTKLFGVEKTPPIRVTLRMVDESLNSANSIDFCSQNQPGVSDFTDIPLKADDNHVYQLDPGAGSSLVTGDGWLRLNGVNPERLYSLYLKGPLQRGIKVAAHRKLKVGKDKSNILDWSDKPLGGGDLPDPKNGKKQNCLINATDVGLLIDRLGKSDQNSLSVADLDYNGIINSADMGILLHTLSQGVADE